MDNINFNPVNPTEFKVGDEIRKTKGYAFIGVVVSVFENTKGQVRIVAEHYGSQTKESGGLLHIFAASQIEKIV
jgi:hypothetical protein